MATIDLSTFEKKLLVRQIQLGDFERLVQLQLKCFSGLKPWIREQLGSQICYDVEFPEVCRIAAEKGAQIIFVPFCTDERYAYLRVRYCARARCIENHVYVAIAGTVGNLPAGENMDIQYAQSGIYTASDFPFTRDAIASECTPNIETVIIDDVDLELLKRHRQTGSVLNGEDRRKDLYEVKLKK